MADSQIPRHNNLPIPLTSFIGRIREIAEVKSLLARTRLLTLTGSGDAARHGSSSRWPPNYFRTMPRESGWLTWRQ